MATVILRVCGGDGDVGSSIRMMCHKFDRYILIFHIVNLSRNSDRMFGAAFPNYVSGLLFIWDRNISLPMTI